MFYKLSTVTAISSPIISTATIKIVKRYNTKSTAVVRILRVKRLRVKRLRVKLGFHIDHLKEYFRIFYIAILNIYLSTSIILPELVPQQRILTQNKLSFPTVFEAIFDSEFASAMDSLWTLLLLILYGLVECCLHVSFQPRICVNKLEKKMMNFAMEISIKYSACNF